MELSKFITLSLEQIEDGINEFNKCSDAYQAFMPSCVEFDYQGIKIIVRIKIITPVKLTPLLDVKCEKQT